MDAHTVAVRSLTAPVDRSPRKITKNAIVPIPQLVVLEECFSDLSILVAEYMFGDCRGCGMLFGIGELYDSTITRTYPRILFDHEITLDEVVLDGRCSFCVLLEVMRQVTAASWSRERLIAAFDFPRSTFKIRFEDWRLGPEFLMGRYIFCEMHPGETITSIHPMVLYIFKPVANFLLVGGNYYDMTFFFE